MDAWSKAMASGGLGAVRRLSAQEIEDARKVFTRFDADNSNSIDKDELAAVMSSMGAYPTADELQAMIDAADTDGNGTVEFEEFLAILSMMPKDEDWEEFEDE